MTHGALPLAALLTIAAVPLAAQNYREVKDSRGRSRTLFGINVQAGFPKVSAISSWKRVLG